MKPNLFKAAQEGDINKLEQLLKEDSFILERNFLNESAETVLHIAVFAGHREFANIVVSKKPELATRLNQDGFNALHIASANGFVEIATDLLKLNPELGRSRSSNGRTALHIAATNGSVDVIRELINVCSFCKDDLTLRGETALHLAVRNGQFEAFKAMVEMLKHHNVEELLNVGNEDGNTVLHYAAAKCQSQILRYIVESEFIEKEKLEMKAKNKNGLTAVELLDVMQQIVADRSDYKVREVLSGDRKPKNNVAIEFVEATLATPSVASSSCNWGNYLIREIATQLNPIRYYRKIAEEVKRSSPETRNVLMIVATLIATVTYQAILNPPAGMPLDELFHHQLEFFVFMVPNSIGFLAAIAVISLMIHKFPLSSLLGLAVRCMAASYICGFVLMSPNSTISATKVTLIFVGCVVSLDIAHFIYRVTRKWYNS